MFRVDRSLRHSNRKVGETEEPAQEKEQGSQRREVAESRETVAVDPGRTLVSSCSSLAASSLGNMAAWVFLHALLHPLREAN